MKEVILNAKAKVAMVVTLLMLNVIAFAQDDKKVDIDINTKGENSNFLMQPWVWVVGGAVFILLLVALLKSNKSN